MLPGVTQLCYECMFTPVKMDPDNAEIKKDAERSRKKLTTLVKKQEILLRGKKHNSSLLIQVVLEEYCLYVQFTFSAFLRVQIK